MNLFAHDLEVRGRESIRKRSGGTGSFDDVIVILNIVERIAVVTAVLVYSWISSARTTESGTEFVVRGASLPLILGRSGPHSYVGWTQGLGGTCFIHSLMSSRNLMISPRALRGLDLRFSWA